MIKFYQMLITITESSIFDPLIGLLEEFISINKHNNENYSDTVKVIRKKLSESIEVLNEGLIDISMNQKTRVTKEELRENVITSIERYYNNVISEIAMFNDELEKVFLHIINQFSKKYIETVGRDLFNYNDCLFVNTNYDKTDFSMLGYKKYDFNKEETMTVDNYYNALKEKINEYISLIEVDYQKEMRAISKVVMAFEAKIKNKVEDAKENFNKIVNDNKNRLIKENDKVIRDIEKEIKKLDKEYINACNNERKQLKKYVSVL